MVVDRRIWRTIGVRVLSNVGLHRTHMVVLDHLCQFYICLYFSSP